MRTRWRPWSLSPCGRARAERDKLREEERVKRKQRLLRSLENTVSSSNILERRRARCRVNYAENVGRRSGGAYSYCFLQQVGDGSSESAGERESEREDCSGSRRGSEESEEEGGKMSKMRTRTRKMGSDDSEQEGRRTRASTRTRRRAESSESGEEDGKWSRSRRWASSESGEESERLGRTRRTRGRRQDKESSVSGEDEEWPRKRRRRGRRNGDSGSDESEGPARRRKGNARRKAEDSSSDESIVSWKSGASGTEGRGDEEQGEDDVEGAGKDQEVLIEELDQAKGDAILMDGEREEEEDGIAHQDTL
eukprot:757169-Hanusia_phi.AAC.2